MAAESSPDLRAFLETFARMLAPLVARELAANVQAAEPEHYASAGPLPSGVSKGRFLAAARAGAFPSFKRGKVVFARREDVRAWIEGGARPAARRPAPDLAAAAAASVARSLGGRR